MGRTSHWGLSSRVTTTLPTTGPNTSIWRRNFCSEQVFDERERCQYLNVLFVRLNHLHVLRSCGLTLAHDLLSLELRITLLLVILLYTSQESLVAPRLTNMLDANVEAFPQLPVTDLLGDLNADRVPVDVEDHPSPAMVKRVRHALLLAGIDVDVNVVATFERREVPGHTRHTLGLVRLGELLARAGAQTAREATPSLTHLCAWSLGNWSMCLEKKTLRP